MWARSTPCGRCTDWARWTRPEDTHGTYEVAAGALDHPSAGVRRNAIAVLPRDERTLAAILDSQLLADPDAQVRLAALLALSEMPPSARAGRAVAEFLAVAENVADRWLPDAAIAAAAAHDRHFLLAVAAGTSARPVGKNAGSDRGGQPALCPRRSGRFGRGTDLRVGLVPIRWSPATVVDSLAAGWPKDIPVDAQAIAAKDWAAMLDKLPGGSKGQWVRLAALWGNESLKAYTAEIARSLLAAVADEKNGDAARAAAARQVIEFQPDNAELVGELVAQIAPRTSPALASSIIGAVGSGRARRRAGVGRGVRRVHAGRQGRSDRRPVEPSGLDAALLDGIEQGAVQLSDLSLDQKQALAAHPDRSIAQRIKQLLDRGGGLPSPDRQQVLEQLLPLAERTGDVEAGQKIYKEQCGKCHLFRGEGTAIGPDLTGMTVQPKQEWLTQTIDPSRSVEGNYRVYTVVTADGRVRSGLLAAETGTSIEMFDAEGKRHVVLREDIDELVASPKSLMPEGFEKQVSETDIVNLLEYVTTRGRFTPLDLRKVATVVTTRGMFTDEASATERLVFADWSPKTFAGVPFHLVDPQGDRVPNAVMLYSPSGRLPPRMPRQVPLTVNQSAAAIHLLSGVGGWSAKQPRDDGSVSMTVRLHYRDGQTEDHPLRDGHHFADYIGHFEVPGSQLAFRLRNQQIRYLAIHPRRSDPITHLELLKGPTAPPPSSWRSPSKRPSKTRFGIRSCFPKIQEI
jgi:uncharacterized protein